MKFLLSVIALCLVMITAKLYIPQAQAKVGGMDKNQLINDKDFKEAVFYIVDKKCYQNPVGFHNISCNDNWDK
jgi:hypothetical protein